MILIGDCREQLKTLADNSIDSIVTDPPYELGFMGKKWDSTGIAYDIDVWKECLRVLKPGGHLLAFSGSRTYHRMVCAIEDAGGSAARFFYSAKASRKDRNDGVANNHPTVKPTDLMRYLCRLVTPPNGTVLDPFTGSGSTGRGAVLEGFNFIGIELDPNYAAIAKARIDKCKSK
jgi:DNA modification methylase